jgi:hypothetical protein
MAVLPSKLDRKIPQLRTGIVQAAAPDTSLAEAGEAITRVMTSRDEYQFNKAKSKFLIDQTKSEDQFNEDPDFSTFESRYKEGALKSKSDALELVSNPMLRNQLSESIDLDIEQGLNRVRSLADKKYKDFERASIDEDLESIRNTAITGDFNTAIDSVVGRLDSAANTGILSQQERADLLQKWKADAAEGWLKTLDPETVLEHTKNPAFKILPPDRQAVIKREAKNLLRDNQAQSIVDGIMPDFTSLTDMPDLAVGLDSLKRIKDPKLRNAAETRYITQFNRANAALKDRAADLYNDAFDHIQSGGSYDDLTGNDELMETLTPHMKQQLINLEIMEASGAKIKTTMELTGALAAAAGRDDKEELQRLLDNPNHDNKISPSDRKLYTKAAFKKEIPKEEQSDISSKQRVKYMVEQAGLEDEYFEVFEVFDQWKRDYLEDNERFPTIDEQNKAIDQLLMRYDPWGPGDKRLYEFGVNPSVSERLVKQQEAIMGRELSEREIYDLLKAESGR